MKYWKTLVIILFVLHGAVAFAQPSLHYPKIGAPLPELSFDVAYSEQGKVKLSALRGKPVLLYFFSKGCVGSFRQLPHVNRLYQKYGKVIRFIAIAKDKQDGMRNAYEQYRNVYKLQLPVVYDTTIYQQLGVQGVPAFVLLDADGIVRAVTYGLTDESLDLFLAGKPFTFPDTSHEGKEAMRKRMSAFVTHTDGYDSLVVQRSTLAVWRPGMPNLTLPSVYEHADPFDNLDALQISGRSLEELYRIAYLGRGTAPAPTDTVAYGKYHYRVILDVRDSTKFMADLLTGKNLYCYTQQLAPENRTKENMMRVMQSDLKDYFGYEVTVEVKKMPYLRLVAKPGTAARLKPDPSMIGKGKGDFIEGVKVYSIIVPYLIEIINYPAQLGASDLPLIDETGIRGEIDIQVKAVMTNLEDVRRALRESGLDILRGEKDMKVIVIRDAQIHVK